MTSGRPHPNYFAVWLWLVGLMSASVAVSFLPFPKAAVVFIIFAIAGVKAVLVALNYMHLKYERLLICSLAIVPLLLFFVLLSALFPDIAAH